MRLHTLGIDLAKSVFHLYGVDASGQRVFERQVRRRRLLEQVAQLPSCHVVMEACGGAHHWGRAFRRLGHEVTLLPPQHVVPYRRSQKNDRNDAVAIVEASSRPEMPTVALKSEEQQSAQSILRVRERLVRQRTSLSNQARGLLLEFGVVWPRGVAAVLRGLAELDDHAELPLLMKELGRDLLEELRALDARIAAYDRWVRALAKRSELCRELERLPGIGKQTALELVSGVGDPRAFANGRQFAASVGLVPSQHSTGGRTRLGPITRRGDVHLRTALVHGARAVLRTAHRHEDQFRRWARQVEARRGRNKATAAVANKLARKAWAVMMHKLPDEDQRLAA